MLQIDIGHFKTENSRIFSEQELTNAFAKSSFDFENIQKTYTVIIALFYDISYPQSALLLILLTQISYVESIIYWDGETIYCWSRYVDFNVYKTDICSSSSYLKAVYFLREIWNPNTFNGKGVYHWGLSQNVSLW